MDRNQAIDTIAKLCDSVIDTYATAMKLGIKQELGNIISQPLADEVEIPKVKEEESKPKGKKKTK